MKSGDQAQVPALRSRQLFVNFWPGWNTGGAVMFLSSRFRSATQAMPSMQGAGVGGTAGVGNAVGAGSGVVGMITSAGTRRLVSIRWAAVPSCTISIRIRLISGSSVEPLRTAIANDCGLSP